MENCQICLEDKYEKVNFNNFFLRTDSGKKKLHDYEMRVCLNCGVVFQYPQISQKDVTEYYRSNYRPSSTIKLDQNKSIFFPLHFEQTGISFQRFYNFYNIINELKILNKIDNIDENKTFLDYGAYQGSFLYACKSIWKVKTIANDFNKEGLKFAKNFLDIDKTYESNDIYKDEFSDKIDFCTVIHVLEHLHDPLKFLKHVKNKIIKNEGYIYVEVPSAESSTYDDPTHLFMFNKDSLKYLFNLAGYDILHISQKKIYDYKKIKLLKRHVQTMVHCVAKPNNKINKINKIYQGQSIKRKLQKTQKINSDKIYLIRLKNVFRELLTLIYYGFFIIMSFFSSKLSFKLFLVSNNYLKKFYLILKKNLMRLF